jgi:hypothetical protein
MLNCKKGWTLALCAGAAVSAYGQTTFPEVEPNDTKAAANGAFVMAPGDMILGNSTGTSTTTAGSASSDYFLVKTTPAPLGVYRYRMVVTTSGSAGHTATLRGLTQTNRVINPGTDAVLQTSSTTSTPPRFVQWYGFGKEEQIYMRVTGTTSTTSDYTATLERTAVTITDLGTFSPGSITIERGLGSTFDADFWVYDSNFNAIEGYGNDTPNLLTRTYTPGVYYIAWTNFNFANNQPAAPDDGFSGSVTDFANVATNSSTSVFTTGSAIAIKITDGAGPVETLITKDGLFDVRWLRFTVSGTPLPTGACCRSDGTCSEGTSAACSSVGGVYQGDNSTCATAGCAPGGSCCVAGVCSTLTNAACTAASGLWGGANSSCATTVCPGIWNEQGDAGELPAAAQLIEGAGALYRINGAISTPEEVDMYKLRVSDFANFSARTVGVTTWDTQLFLFDAAGLGVVTNDDEVGGTTLQSRITNQFVTANGEYYLAISRYNRDPVSGGSNLIFNVTVNRSEVPANGPGATAPVDAWITAVTAAAGNYGILLTGSEYLGNACYANCDGSTVPPILNVGDFTCFLQRFAAGDSYANCDGSTIPPVLNVGDFTCFLQRFAAGCP